MDYVSLAFGVFGFIAFVRQQKLIQTLKAKGLLDEGYKAD